MKTRLRIILPILLLLLVLAAGAFLVRRSVVARQKTDEAMALLEAENYDAAYALLLELGRDDTVAASINMRADALLAAGEGNEAYALLSGLTNENSRAKRMEIKRKQIAETPVGRSFTFGRYEQDNDQKNGPEPIRWVVLARKGNLVLVISKYVLDCRRYDEERRSVTWETCTLRAWLNGEFLTAAFDADELTLMETARVTADPNPIYDVDPGNDTEDRLFLLSLPEAEAYFLPDGTGVPKGKLYAEDYPALLCEPTRYAAAQGCTPQSENGSARWWLRTPGLGPSSAAWVTRTGGLRDNGSLVNCENSLIVPGVRPAMWIDLGEEQLAPQEKEANP